MKKIINLNNNWQYVNSYQVGMENQKTLSNYECVNIPHANIEIPYNYFDEKIFQFISCYKKSVFIDKEYKNKIAVIRFEAVMTYAKVYLNGRFIGEHKGGYTPFEFTVNDYIIYGEENVLTLVVDSTERGDIPPFGGQIDYLTYGGIYREVSICFFDQIYIKNGKIEIKDIDEDKKSADVDLYIQNYVGKEAKGNIVFELTNDEGEVVYEAERIVDLSEKKGKYSFLLTEIEGVVLWDIDNPYLYNFKARLDIEGCTDIYDTKIGFRKCEFTAEGFFLNNKKIKLVGLNRHQSYPYNGYAMPKRVQEKDAELLKNDLHVNVVRTSHYPQSIHFLNKCDELGLLVFEEIPGWQHIGNEEWKQVAIENVREMIERDWNHPSIIIWGVRINESMDDDYFYERTNQLARELDSTRQTGGVRYMENSHLLEDVYTMNDFAHEGGELVIRDQKKVTGLAEEVPYLITEYNGHMYPTKKFDQEERQMEHVLRHLRIINEMKLSDNISGAIAWCMFDYNTHKDFGAGDRICYHGVMDIYRNKKFAAYAYKSQVSPEIEVVLKPVTFWARGERSIGGILPLVVLTNCEYIELKYGSFKPVRFYPAKEEFRGLDHPPVMIRMEDVDASQMGEWGMKWEDCVINGFVNGELVTTTKFAKDPLPTKLSVEIDDFVLEAKEKDGTRVIVKAKDQFSNDMPFIEDIIEVKVDGVGRIIGPDKFVLTGGSRGFWIETVNEVGEINIEINSMNFGTQQYVIEVK